MTQAALPPCSTFTQTGQLYIISAPSGAGKTSLVRQLLIEVEQLVVSVSHTTRPIRPGEQNGKDYHFVSLTEFEALISKNALLEHAKVFDNYYGTAQQTVNNYLKQGQDVILEIDWQGAQQIRQLRPDCVSIFILPPSVSVLEHRLRSRGQDDANVISRRMAAAVAEMSHYYEYDYLVVNDDFTCATQELKTIILANRLTKNRQQQILHSLIASLIEISN